MSDLPAILPGSQKCIGIEGGYRTISQCDIHLKQGIPSGRIRRRIHEQPNTCQPPAIQPATTDVEGFDSLAELALDMRSSWNHAADQVWRQLGPALGGWLVDVPGADFSRPFFVVAAGGALVWLAVWFGLPEADVPRPAAVSTGSDVQPAALSVNAILLLVLLGLFGLGSFEVAIALQGAQVLGFDPWRIGVLFMACSLVMVLVQLLVFSPLVRRVGFAHIIAPAFGVIALGLLALPFVTGFSVVLMLVSLVAAGSGILLLAVLIKYLMQK